MRPIKSLVVCLLISLLILSTAGVAYGQETGYSIYLPIVLTRPGPCSTAPTLLAPENMSSLNTLIPTFQWENGESSGVTEVHFLLTLHKDDFPNDWVLWVTSTNSSFEEQAYKSKNLIPSTPYYWQVWLKCGAVESPHSGIWTFTTGTDGTILPGPELFSPANEALIYASDLPLTLQWSPVSGATEYMVVIRRWADGFWYLAYREFVAQPYYQIPYMLIQNTWYQWEIYPINDYALGSPSSRIFQTYW